MAAAALPTALALGVGAASIPAHAQSTDPGNLTGYLDHAPVQRTPVRTDFPKIEGLPQGVAVERAEWLNDRRVALFIRSVAMPEQLVQVQVLLARDWYLDPQRTYPSVWVLDGLRATDEESGWTINTNIEQFYSDKNVNVVLPIGGQSSFYSDWQQPDNGKHYKWETFLTQELVPVLREGYRTNDDRAVVGLSMGGTAAVNLAERRPDLFNFVASFSGYLDTTSPGMPTAIRAAQQDAGGYNTTAMWGPDGSQDWIDHDPKLGIEALRGKGIYVSSGSGEDDFGKKGSVARGPANSAGIGLEVLSRMTSQTFVNRARAAGIEPVVAFRPSGVHDWPYWQFEMTQAWPHIANSLKLSDADRGTSCAPIGAIAQAVADGKVGACVTNEYDVAGGRAEDFVGGRAYWSPATGAHALYGRIGARYASMGGPESWLGFPTSTERKLGPQDGRYATFEHGNIYWTHKLGAVPVARDVLDVWGTQGYENGPLGYPVENDRIEDGVKIQRFEHGFVLVKDGKGFWTLGDISKKYAEMGLQHSPLGLPTSNELAIKGGAFQRFEHGNIYWSPSTGAHVVYYGDIFDAWGKKGWEQGEYGYPVKDQTDIPAGGKEIAFQHGTIRQVNGRIEESR